MLPPGHRDTGKELAKVLPSFRVRCDEGPHAPRDLGSGSAKATTRPASSACIGPVLGFRIAGARHYFHSHLYFPSGSWPRIVALPASPPFCTEGRGFIPMVLILTGFRQNNKTRRFRRAS